MQIHVANLETCNTATGVVVAIDVIRAYTTAAYALAAGADKIILTATVEQALEHRQNEPSALLMGEVNGLFIPGFDFGNSPSALIHKNLAGRTLVHRTSAGTQVAARAIHASKLFGASFTVAAATVRSLQILQPAQITLVVTGQRPDDPGDEDRALADYLTELLVHGPVDPADYLFRVRSSLAAQKFLDPSQPDYPAEDLECCLQLDRFSFSMPVDRRGSLNVLHRQDS